MTKTDSLCAWVLKGKYYPNGEFLTATKKKHASHTWRAILTGRNALSYGLIRRIGDGTQTNVWTDRWIPDAIGNKPICRLESATATTVNDMINQDDNSWGIHALSLNLIPSDADVVCRIPLGRAHEDVWAWSAEHHGCYSVRSAYRLLITQEK
uniref:Reverse transcriptase zinc-binding domain-containing protein n=1 Tax=Arundo donax TaxID=35708 RepID=A0A0A8ZAR8_ARUDO